MHHCKQLLARPELHIQQGLLQLHCPFLKSLQFPTVQLLCQGLPFTHSWCSKPNTYTHEPTYTTGLFSHHLLLHLAAEHHPRQASVWLDVTDHSIFSNPEASYSKASSTAVLVRLFIFLSCHTSQDTAAHAAFICSPRHLPPASRGWSTRSMATPTGTRRTLLWPPGPADHSSHLCPHKSNLVMGQHRQKLLECLSAEGLKVGHGPYPMALGHLSLTPSCTAMAFCPLLFPPRSILPKTEQASYSTLHWKILLLMHINSASTKTSATRVSPSQSHSCTAVPYVQMLNSRTQICSQVGNTCTWEPV